MIACDVVRTVSIATVPLAAALERLTIGHLLAAFVTGLATVLFQVAYQSYLPLLVYRDDLARGTRNCSGSQSVADLVGPGLGGLLAQALRAPFALLVDAAGYLAPAVALGVIRKDEPVVAVGAERDLRREIRAGVRFVVHDRYLRVMTIAPAIDNFCSSGTRRRRGVPCPYRHPSPGAVGVGLTTAGLAGGRWRRRFARGARCGCCRP